MSTYCDKCGGLVPPDAPRRTFDVHTANGAGYVVVWHAECPGGARLRRSQVVASEPGVSPDAFGSVGTG
jgi:hypothetical protein